VTEHAFMAEAIDDVCLLTTSRHLMFEHAFEVSRTDALWRVVQNRKQTVREHTSP